MESESKIFVQNRILGYVSNDVPLVTRYIKRRKENLVVTCVNKAFYTWGCNRFSLLSVSQKHVEDIICLAADTFLIFTSSGNIVQAWRRGVELIQTYKSSSNTPVHFLLPFGPHLIGIDETNVLIVWDIKTTDIYVEVNLPVDSFRVTAICHPHCYINKILLGSEQGSMQLWNISSSKLIYTFPGWNSVITVLKQAPALDVVGVGLQSGKILLHNIKTDETLITFMQDWGCISSLSFRSDGPAMMASGSTSGHVVFWNLEERKVVSQLVHAHDASVTGMEFLPNEPLMVTSSPDNSLKLWIFDMPDGGARLLRIREGHSAPPTFIRYHGSLGNYVLSAGSDGYLRAFNTVVEIANKNLGRALYRKSNKNMKRKLYEEIEEELVYSTTLPPIVRFTSETTREKEWDNIAAIHNGTPIISTWSFDKCKLGTYLFNKKYKIHAKFRQRMQDTDTLFKKVSATSICLTHCGNFILIGYNTGDVDKYNIQSGLLRGSYGSPQPHRSAVTGIAVNNLNQVAITGSRDATIKFWSFRHHEKPHLFQITVNDSVSFFVCHAESSILAVALDNFDLIIIDTDSRSIIRQFSGHSSALTDVALSPDARWVITASMDSTIKTWDIPSGKRIDSFPVDKPCVSVTFCPTGGFIATAHVDCLGVALWTNRCMFSFVPLNTDEPLTIRLDDDVESLNNDLITLSTNDESCPIASRWQNIFNIDVIRERNRAKEPPKVPQPAPFILPVITSVNVEFDVTQQDNEKENTDDPFKTKLLSFTTFAKLLSKARDNDYHEAIDKIKTLSPSVINFEILSLSPENGGSVEVMQQFLDMIKTMILQKKHFELSTSYLGLFLKLHSSTITEHSKLSSSIKELYDVHQKVWSNLENKLLYSISVSKFLRDL